MGTLFRRLSLLYIVANATIGHVFVLQNPITRLLCPCEQVVQRAGAIRYQQQVSVRAEVVHHALGANQWLGKQFSTSSTTLALSIFLVSL